MTRPSDTHGEPACRELIGDLLANEQALFTEIVFERRGGGPFADLIGSLPYTDRGGWLFLLGNVLWEIFSANNEVRGPRGRAYDLGSWRGSGGFVAGVLNERYGRAETGGRFDYLDFYCGLMRPHDEALRPLYVHFFRALRARGCTWAYRPPAVYVIDFDRGEDEAPETYDPEVSAADQLGIDRGSTESGSEDRPGEPDELRDALRDYNEESWRRARQNPPVIVMAHQDVYDRQPPYLSR